MFGAAKDKKTELKERRVFERFVARLPVRLLESEEKFSVDTYMRDISAEGARLVIGQRLTPEEKIDLCVQIPDGKEPLRLSGKVVWAKELGRDVWDTGIRFPRIRFMNLYRVFNI